MSFYGAATGLSQSQSKKTRPIIDIVTITNYSRLALILAALAIAGQLEAQVDLPAPESGSEDQTETTPSPELLPHLPLRIPTRARYCVERNVPAAKLLSFEKSTLRSLHILTQVVECHRLFP